MKLKIRGLNRSVHAAIVIMVVVGIFIQFINQKTDFHKWNLFTYYTIQSNIIVMIVSLYALISKKQNKTYYSLRLGSVLLIGVTGIVFHLLLNDIYQPKGIMGFANHCLHTYVPLLSIISWLMFESKSKISRTAPMIWSIYPFTYLVFTLTRGEIKGYYPYYFLNPNTSGYLGVLTFSVVLLIGFLMASYILIFFNNRKV